MNLFAELQKDWMSPADAWAAMSKESSVLTARGRGQVKEKNFAIPEREAYPIHDLAHARNALTRVEQHGSAEEKVRVRSAVTRKYPALAARSTVLGKETEKKSSVAEFWKSLPPAVQAALVAAPTGAAASGLGQYLSSRPMASGQSKEEVLTRSAADKAQAMGEARGGHGYAGQLAEEAMKGSYGVAQANREHPVRAALLAALLGGTITGGGAAGTAALLSKLR